MIKAGHDRRAAPARSPPAARRASRRTVPTEAGRRPRRRGRGRPLSAAMTGRTSSSQLELRPDGRFRFMLAAGALDRACRKGAGPATAAPSTLNTEPRPTPPAFTAGPVTRTGRSARSSILVNGPNGRGIASDRPAASGFADGRVLEGYTQDYGWQLCRRRRPPDAGLGRAFAALSTACRRAASRSTPRRATLFTFTLIPNDLGVPISAIRSARDHAGRARASRWPGGTGTFARERLTSAALKRRETDRRVDMAKIFCVLYADPVDGYPTSYPRDDLPDARTLSRRPDAADAQRHRFPARHPARQRLGRARPPALARGERPHAWS